MSLEGLNTKQNNKGMNDAKKRKDDEFYTLYQDVENELSHYNEDLKGKVIYCNCDNPEESNFWKYLSDNFDKIGLRKLVCTFYSDDAYKTEKVGAGVIKTKLKGNGDFRSEECLEILEECDVVITNPPFSLFREFVEVVYEYKKDLLIIGSINAISYINIFPLLKSGELKMGHNAHIVMNFKRPNEEGCKKVGGITWFTTFNPNHGREEKLKSMLSKEYNPEDYPKYDNNDAIEVSKTKDIPIDYNGVMGVPITYLTYHNPEMFEIIGSNAVVNQYPKKIYGRGTVLNGKRTYTRLFIKRKQIR